MNIKKFGSKNCSQCRSLSKALDSLGIVCEEIDAFENEDIAKEYNVTSLPTLIREDGERLVGMQTMSKLKEFCKV